ncbi:MAG: 3-hydroxyacyl-CoA dehydrogenase [Rubrivivax sp.]
MTAAVHRVGIVGAGAMGRGIAQVCALAGCDVLLLDSQPEAVARAIEAIRAELAQSVAKGRLPREQADAAVTRLRGAASLAELAGCELVVEAIVERLDAKQALLRELEAIVGPACILATNTSSLSVTAIAAACAQPQRVAGWHFFNPVPRMKLVEVVRAPRTAEPVVQALLALSERIGHRAVVTGDSPGFVVNHAGRAFVTEGLKLLAERCAEHAVIDGILRAAGFRMGPFELLDLTALDVSVPVMESIHAQYYGDDRYRPVALARTRLQAGLLGRKSGEGFYRYSAGAAADAAPAAAPPPAASPGAIRPWWPTEGPAVLPPAIAAVLPARHADARTADLCLVAPLGADLSTTVAELGLDAAKAVAVDPLFCGKAGVTLMGCPATAAASIESAKALFAAQTMPVFVVADTPGFVAPRVVAGIVNLACEMAQQGVASPSDIDAAVRLGLGYPAGPFEWGDRLGAGRVLQVLQGLQTTFGDPRYRPSPWLLRRAKLGLPLGTPDRSGW